MMMYERADEADTVKYILQQYGLHETKTSSTDLYNTTDSYATNPLIYRYCKNSSHLSQNTKWHNMSILLALLTIIISFNSKCILFISSSSSGPQNSVKTPPLSNPHIGPGKPVSHMPQRHKEL